MAVIVVGSGPGAAFDDFEDAIAAAEEGDTIEFESGVINLEDPGGGPMDGSPFRKR